MFLVYPEMKYSKTSPILSTISSFHFWKIEINIQILNTKEKCSLNLYVHTDYTITANNFTLMISAAIYSITFTFVYMKLF